MLKFFSQSKHNFDYQECNLYCQTMTFAFMNHAIQKKFPKQNYSDTKNWLDFYKVIKEKSSKEMETLLKNFFN